MSEGAPACPVCGALRSFVVEARERLPLVQNRVYPSAAAAQACEVGSLEMRRCEACGFVWNARFDAGLSIYEEGYDNDQTFSEVFIRHLEQVAERIVGASALARPNLLEIGCGQGSFLRRLTARMGGRLGAVAGFDPAWRGDQPAPAGAVIHADYFTPQSRTSLGFRPDIVVSRHTIEHVPDPAAFVAAIRSACGPGARLFIETPTVDWILANGVIFDFFYEHCSLFNPTSLQVLLEANGLEVDNVETVFDGQYMLASARAPLAGGAATPGPANARQYDDLGYLARRDRFLAQLRDIVRTGDADGGAALWGAASKGVTLALLLGEDAQRLRCAIDINERKQGAYMPMSGLPVVSPEEACRRGVRAALAVNPAYVGEIRKYCAEHGLPLRIEAAEP